MSSRFILDMDLLKSLMLQYEFYRMIFVDILSKVSVIS
jgi:hypothetical protein